MKEHQYQPQQLAALLESLRSKKVSGTLSVNATVTSTQKRRNRVLTWQNGEITYGGYNVPKAIDFVEQVGQKFKPDLIKAALNFASKKVANPDSPREVLALLVKTRVLTWEQIEAYTQAQTAIALEQILPHGGEFRLEPEVQFEISHGAAGSGLDWSKIQSELERRQQQWESLAPSIPSMDAIPHLGQGGLATITDPNARKHIQQWVDGHKSLVEIAQKLDKDPLKIAQTYLNWAQLNWIVFNHNVAAAPSIEKQLPTILSVDDSPIVQATIKKALSDHYNLLLASNAKDALRLLNQKPVDLMLLDVTMPDIDGLEMCRTVRSIPKFRDLPIVMLTARDGYVDKLKGQIAGTTMYLTKPFDAEKLLEVAGKYINNKVTKTFVSAR